MDFQVVQILEGKVKGTFLNDWNGEKFHAFLSIPYGKPPIGRLRFKAPQPAESWTGVLDATKQGDGCIQYAGMPPTVGGSEDCLNLHVFTKNLPSEDRKLKPVIVWIHGGAFTMGNHDINIYGPDKLMTEDIVLVSITYRVGLLGFLSLQDTSLDIPGNAGLKDQVLALKWVQKNIKNFNGDPNNVTIFGESAGGASVEYLLLTPSAKGLFHKAIAMSGSTFNPWARGFFDPFDFANFLGHPNLSETDILKLMTDMPAADLFLSQNKYEEETHDLGLIGPVIEKSNHTAFIDKHPIDIIQSGEYNKVPIIMGYCDNEGLLEEFFKRFKKMMGRPPKKEPANINEFLPNDISFSDFDQVKKITDKLIKFYSQDEYKNTPTLYCDAMFVIGILVSAINHAKVSKNPIFLYRFSFDGELGMLKKMVQIDIPGVCHGDDLGYIFTSKESPRIIGESEKLTVKRIITMWTNFAKYGNPTPNGNDLNIEWKPLQSTHINFLEIGMELIPGVKLPEAERLQLWKEVFKMNPVTAKFF